MNKNSSIKNQVITGSFWIFGANLISRGVSLLSTLFLAKLLTPDDFGVIGYGFLIVSAIGLIREMGFNSALIYQKNEIEKAASASLIFIFLWSMCLYLIVFVFAPIAAAFFREARLVGLLRVLTISLVLNSLSSIPMSLMSKEIDFKRRVIPEVLNLLVYGIVTVVFAYLDFNYWAFVIGVLSADTVQLISAILLRPIRMYRIVDFRILRELFRFGKNILGLNVLNFGIRNIDDFVVGRMLGTVQLGIYNFAYRIANIPATNITNVIGKVLYPGFVKIADNTQRLREAFLKSLQYVTFLTIPVTLYIILIIPDVVHLFFPKWVAAIVPIQLIAYFGGVRSIGSGTGSVVLAKGKPELLLPVSLTQLVVLALFLYPVTRFWGLTGVCILVNASITISFIWSFLLVKKLTDISLKSVLQILTLPFLISVALILVLSIDSIESLSNWKYYLIVLKGVGFPVLFLIISLLFTNTFKVMIRDLKGWDS